MTIFRCPHCGAEIAYDPSKELIVCEYCGSEITVDDYNKYSFALFTSSINKSLFS